MNTTNSNFSVGQHHSGRIINFAPKGILVELQPGVIGIVENAVKESDIDINDSIDVRITALGASNEIYLERIPKSVPVSPTADAATGGLILNLG